MFKRLFSRSIQHAVDVAKPMMDKLEDRTLFSVPTIASCTADNRGEVFINVSAANKADINTSTINSASIQMYTAGPDGHLGGVDDVKIHAALNYNTSIGRLTVRGAVPANIGYRVRIVSSRFKSLEGDLLDGEFNGAAAQSGNGTAGGIYEFQVKNDRSSTPTVRMSTSLGTINLTMRGDVAPLTVQNFLNYANTDRYDNTFFTRSIAGFIIQGGSLQINRSDQLVATAIDASPTNEFHLSNTRGTLALAKSGGDPNSGTNQFFFNLGDNSSNLDNQNGGFTVFAQTDTNGLATMDAIAAKPIVALNNSSTGHGVYTSPDPHTDVTTTPVNTTSGLTGTNETLPDSSTGFVVTGGFDAQADLITIRRVAVLSKPIALPPS